MKVEILQDVNFEHEIGTKGISSALTAHQVFSLLSWPGAKKDYKWTIAEWASRYLFKDVTFVKEEDGAYKFYNDAKHVKVFPGKGKIELFADTRKEYDAPRGGSDPWIHLLLEQAIPMEKRVKLSTLKNLYMELEFVIDHSDKYMSDEEYDTNRHASQCSWYLTVENCACKQLDFEGRPDYYWFGLPMYDNRFDTMDPAVFLDYGTQKLICAKKRAEYLEEPLKIGKVYKFKVDVLPKMKECFDKTQELGWLKGATWEDMAIGSTNIGWEIPGTFSAGLIINKLSITGELK